MGIYPRRHTENHQRGSFGGETWTEVETQPGIIRKRKVEAHQWVETRTDCFCCSCPDWGGGDPYCRNHGFAGERPCERHNMPGSPDEESGVMPESVQAARAKRVQA